MVGVDETVLACTVRGCGLPLVEDARTMRCPAGHTFDKARSGYVNLLQPQDRRSRQAGDSPLAAAARERLLVRGIGAGILDTVAAVAARLAGGGVVADLGAGTGALLDAVTRRSGTQAIGIDLSAPAMEYAARRRPDIRWVVANVDRGIPVTSHSLALVLSMHARRHAAETARVLVRGGYLAVIVPGADDLAELRSVVEGTASQRDRADGVVREHEGYIVCDRQSLRERHPLDREALQDLLAATYRGARRSAAARVAALDRLTVTLAAELLVLRPPASDH